MKVLFHALKYFSLGGVAEDASALFNAMSCTPHIEVETVFIEPSHEIGMDLVSKTPIRTESLSTWQALKAQLVVFILSIYRTWRAKLIASIKFVMRCFVPKKYRKQIKQGIKRRLFSQNSGVPTPTALEGVLPKEEELCSVTKLDQETVTMYLERFRHRSDQHHLHQLMSRPCYYVDRFVDDQDLAMDIGHWDCLFLPFFIHPTNFSSKFLYLIRLHDICFVKGKHYQMSGDTDHLITLLDGVIDKDNVLFICNSPYSQKQLEAYAPQTKGRNYLLPCQVPEFITKKQNKAEVQKICTKYRSWRHLRAFNLNKVERAIESLEGYILVVGGEHARKNYEALLEGWLMYKNQHPENKLPIIWVGYACGDYMGSFIDDAKPLINQGEIIHLEHVHREGLNQLFMHAKAFVVASHDEGFGIPPLEAQQFGCPVIASDIPVHRWVLAAGALFFDGTKPQQLCDRLTQLLDPKAEMLRKHLVQRGTENAERFYPETVDKTLVEVLSEIEVTQLPKFKNMRPI